MTGKPRVLVSPTAEQVAKVVATEGIGPLTPPVAVVVGPGGVRSFDLPHPRDESAVDEVVQLAIDAAAREEPEVESPTASPPTGVRYLRRSYSTTVPFTYAIWPPGLGNGPGTLDLARTVWGFLDQSASGNAQYLVVESRLTLSAGRLAADSDEGRGFGNANFTSQLDPGLNAFDFQPTGGGSIVPVEFSVQLSYRHPTGGFQMWEFSTSTSSTFEGWEVATTSAGSALGAMWWMTSPCDGSHLADTWRDAWVDGRVVPLTPPSANTLVANSISAWRTDPRSGQLTVPGFSRWTGVGLLLLDGEEAYLPVAVTAPNTGFVVDLTPIVPT